MPHIDPERVTTPSTSTPSAEDVKGHMEKSNWKDIFLSDNPTYIGRWGIILAEYRHREQQQRRNQSNHRSLGGR